MDEEDFIDAAATAADFVVDVEFLVDVDFTVDEVGAFLLLLLLLLLLTTRRFLYSDRRCDIGRSFNCFLGRVDSFSVSDDDACADALGAVFFTVDFDLWRVVKLGLLDWLVLLLLLLLVLILLLLPEVC